MILFTPSDLYVTLTSDCDKFGCKQRGSRLRKCGWVREEVDDFNASMRNAAEC